MEFQEFLNQNYTFSEEFLSKLQSKYGFQICSVRIFDEAEGKTTHCFWLPLHFLPREGETIALTDCYLRVFSVYHYTVNIQLDTDDKLLAAIPIVVCTKEDK